jgi:ribosome modulation factor
MSDQLRDIVGQMVAAGESEADIAAVIQRLSAEPEPAGVPPGEVGTGRIQDRQSYKELEADGFGPLLEGAAGGGVAGAGMLKVGEKAVGLGQKLAQRIYTGLLKPKQAVKDSFGGSAAIAETALAERAPITQRGLAKVQSRLGQSRQAALGEVAKAEQQGMQGVTPGQVVSEFGDVVKELRNRADIGQPNEMARVGQRGAAIVKTANRNAGDIPLTRAQKLKETAQDAASGAYRAMERGGQKQLSADDMLDAATARGLRSGIEARVPAVAAHNQRSQGLIGVQRAMEDALERESNTLGVGGAKDMLALMTGGGAMAAGAGPAAIPIAVGTRLMTTPSTGSMAAILLNDASKSGVLDAATRAAMISMMRNRQ